ncbi:CPA1 [[Candida] subhashii]|uniref:CPA1 n=1 Tax=[Candida] subhashii TaxID=561895 RepID=A0A8J5UK73_9ASCO|nr:CPA1 [[Candida] subhashii]KAG7665208.1 CPA1 [[Candida] subhashii]
MNLHSKRESQKENSPPSYENSVSSSTSSIPSSPQLTTSSKSKIPPILRRKSSLTPTTSSSETQKKRNVPYQPSVEQKRHIEKITSSQSEPLSSVPSRTQTEYFDVLPSFQMFQSILKRDTNQFSEDLHTSPPPLYGEVTSRGGSQPSISSAMEEVTRRVSEYELAEEHERAATQRFLFEEELVEDPELLRTDVATPHNASVDNQNVAVTHDIYGNSPLDNIDRLQKLPSSPIDIQIYVTKQVPIPHEQNELETRLKEYTSGDFVNGYIVVTNTSDKPVEFGLFTVSLEGTIKATERNLNLVGLDFLHKYNRILMKKFLKMYDLNASYGYTQVPNSAGIEYVPYTMDNSDGCYLALPTDRILAPNTKYKKFFTFRFPTKLLDTACINSLLPHVLPPPSLGVDRTCFHNRGENIHLNKALGYGFLNIRGTPLLTKDYSFEDISISYTIEAKFIDKVNSKDQKVPFSYQEINDPEADSDSFVISKSSQYFLRFIPDLKEQFEYYRNDFRSMSEDGIDKRFLADYYNLSTWRSIHMQNFKIERELEEKMNREEMNNDQIKQKNLSSQGPVSNYQNEKANLKADDQDPNSKYKTLGMLGTKIPTEIFGKKKKLILSSLVKIGQSHMYVKVPDKVIPYSSPRLLMKYNNEEETKDLRPVSSNMKEIYNRDEGDLINSVDISLHFLPNDSTIKPPQISSIEANVVFWTYYTEYPLPFELGYDFFYTNPQGDDKLINDPAEITRINLQTLKDQVANYITFLKLNELYVSRDSYLYLKSIKSLGVKKDTVKEYFKTISPVTHSDLLNNEAGWKCEQLPNKKFKWCKDFSVPLQAINKHNVTLLPSFQSCLVGRLYCLQIVVKYKGTGHENEFADNIVKLDVPMFVG